MKYFDKLSADVESAFGCRGVNTESLKYCVKADLDGEGCYYDVYIAFDSENLYMLSGYDRLKKKGKHYDAGFDFKEFAEYPVKDIERLSVDRYTYTSRLMARFADGREMPLARFSAGYGEKFEQFCRRFECLKKGETPDDSSLEDKHLYCPKCGEKYPDPNRRYCPHCTKKSSIFKRLLGLFADNKKPMFIILALIWLRSAWSLPHRISAPSSCTTMFSPRADGFTDRFYMSFCAWRRFRLFPCCSAWFRVSC